MCPDRHFISLYLDGELPSPWKEKMGTHLESCEECRAVFTKYNRLTEQLGELEAEEKTVEAAQERVWAKVSEWQDSRQNQETLTLGSPKFRSGSIWRRRVTLPLPAAAAAVLVVVAFFALVGIRGLGKPASPNEQVMAFGGGLDDHGMIQIQDMAGVLQYLTSQDNGDFMVISLPEIRKFSRIGEPSLINAADYSRSNVFR